jgi:hypothetical protein
MSGEVQPSWRNHLAVHPAAELFPMMSESELRELGEDIKKNGLMQTIVYCKAPGDKKAPPVLLDGRNRLEAMELLGIATVDENGIVRDRNGAIYNGTELAYPSLPDRDPYELVLSLNIHRRHLNAEQKRDLIAKLLKAKPGDSNRKIAKQVKADDKTVASVRRDLESTAEIPKLDKTTGVDGKARSKSKRKKSAKRQAEEERARKEIVALVEKATAADPEFAEWLYGRKKPRATGSAEISIEQRRAENARLDESDNAPADEVDKRVSCVTKAILRHAEGLSINDTERFYTALRDRINDIAGNWAAAAQL